MMDRNNAQACLESIQSGDHALLAQCITRLESPKKDDIIFSRSLMEATIACSKISMRLAVTGTPGAGKSTFIERFCLHLHKKKPQRIAILTIDPSSAITGGSILGDQARMEKLGHHPDFFLRTSPARDFLGGTGIATREALLLCEAAGYETIVLETVGTGQSEKGVTTMVDFLLLLLSPAGGDDLQGIKRGILEHVDMIAINKADGKLKALAHSTARFYQDASHMGFKASKKEVLCCSALEDEGIQEILISICESWIIMHDNENLIQKRDKQQMFWMEEIYAKTVWQHLHMHLRGALAHQVKEQFRQGHINIYQATQKLIDTLDVHMPIA